MERKNIIIDTLEDNSENLVNSNRKQYNSKRVRNILVIIVLIVIGMLAYSKYNFNDFSKGVREKWKTSFSRDANVKYSDMKSYKIKNKDYNDAIFYKNIKVEPNTPYKVTCMVKTEDVENQNGKYYGGAQIAITGGVEFSESLTGTNDWTELTFMFNSNNRTDVNIGFRLGGYAEKSKGTAWFSDFKIEEGVLDSNNKWDFACFIIENVDLDTKENNIPNNVKLQMSYNDKESIKSNMRRLETTLKSMSNNQMQISYEIINIKKPLTSITYDKEHEYFVDVQDVKGLIHSYIKKKEYDYIFVAVKLGDLNKEQKGLVHDWIGLGGMDYYGIGYSNIRLPDESNSYIYKYHPNVNTFPEEIFLHEFLHTLERNEQQTNNNTADLHDHEKYGYSKEKLLGLKKWYEAYMKNTIKNSDGTYAGLTKNAYMSKPIHESNFKYSYELNALEQPQNLIEEISSIIKRIKLLFKK